MTGGSEATICPVGIQGFTSCKALSTNFNENPSQSSRPFDEQRDGFVMGEGAAILILEELHHALERKAKIFCEIKGYGMSSDAYHYTLPDGSGDGAFRAMNNSIKDAKLDANDIQYINAHGTSTPAGDKAEAIAIDRLLSDSNNKICVSSTKSQIGHLLGAAGAVEAVYSIMSINNGIIPINKNLINELKSEKINFIKDKPLKLSISNVISNSFGFGGTNVSLIFSKFYE